VADGQIVRSIPFSAVRTPPIDRGSGSSSPTSSPPHFPLFDVNSGDNGQDPDDVVGEGIALRHALHGDQVEGISRSLVTGDFNLGMFTQNWCLRIELEYIKAKVSVATNAYNLL
jgi:hypothetical protein